MNGMDSTTERLRISGLLLTGLILCTSVTFALAAPLQNSASSAYRKLTDTRCLTPQEAELIGLVNQYRILRGLPAVPVSKSLVKVARIHVMDLQKNSPYQGQDARGMNCNLHSWSAQGYWIPVCYTADHHYANLMRSKPGEINGKQFDAPGYEIVYWTSSAPPLPVQVIAAWDRSPDHRAILLETGKWAGASFKALGVGISDHFTTLWLSPESDPRGSLPLCGDSLR
jgi:uncharacterized protein YkwD